MKLRIGQKCGPQLHAAHPESVGVLWLPQVRATDVSYSRHHRPLVGSAAASTPNNRSRSAGCTEQCQSSLPGTREPSCRPAVCRVPGPEQKAAAVGSAGPLRPRASPPGARVLPHARRVPHPRERAAPVPRRYLIWAFRSANSSSPPKSSDTSSVSSPSACGEDPHSAPGSGEGRPGCAAPACFILRAGGVQGKGPGRGLLGAQGLGWSRGAVRSPARTPPEGPGAAPPGRWAWEMRVLWAPPA